MTEQITYANGSTSSIEEGRRWVTTQTGEGWKSLLESLFDDLVGLGWNGELHQVKEKFGGLRFYTGGLTQAQSDRVTQAEQESYKTCQVCGEPGEPNKDGGWITTRCVPCRTRETNEDKNGFGN